MIGITIIYEEIYVNCFFINLGIVLLLEENKDNTDSMD